MAKEVDMGEQYFEQLKCLNIKHYNYLLHLGKGSLVSGFRIYKNSVITIRDELSDMYFYLEEKRHISNFSKYLHNEGMYKNQATFSSLLPKAAFNLSSNLSYKSYNKYLKILNMFKIYKEAS